jgi:hypothetical protein
MKLVSFRRFCTGEATASGRLARNTAIAGATGATSTASWRSFTLFKVNTKDDGERNMALLAYRCDLSRPMPAAM